MAEGQTLDQAFREIAALRQQLATADKTILRMQAVGGFADSKALSTRSQRLEERVEVLEFDNTLHKDVTAFTVDLVGRHLCERHGLDLDRDNSPDVIFLRKIKKRLRQWAEESGLMRKRSDLRSTRQDENRLRPISHS